jgi:hypothetical protein
MKRTLVLLAAICLASGCAWLGGQDHQGGDYSGASGLERGTTGVSTGADAGAPGTITGSGNATH